MDTKVTGTPVAARDAVNVVTFGVGHGDCLLVEFTHAGQVELRLLYDSGATLPAAALTRHLGAAPRGPDLPDIDIVVLSHVDNDHQGGLHALFATHAIRIGQFWSPCLPAFERLAWLFPERVRTAIERAGKLEAACDARGIPVIYPMEDHVERFGTGNAVTISVISPARRLLRRLYTARGADLGELLGRTPLPLEWLVRGTPAGGEGDNRLASPFDGTTAPDRALFGDAPPVDPDSGAALREQARDAARDEGLEFEPEFFGNSVLNDTSLVLVIDAVLDGVHRRRIVLAGDQENWSYISSRHPMGLAPDVLKVPHHGGRVYLGDVNRHAAGDGPMTGIGQFFLWMRPRVAIVSAKGVHNLPRPEFREAVRMVGSTLVCPNVRGKEILFAGGDSPAATSCYQQHACTPRYDAITLTLAAQHEAMDAPACLQGTCHRGPAPVVVMQQRLIEPDESFVRWTSTEVRKQAAWLAAFLHDERKRLLASTADALAARVDVEPTSWERVRAEARADGHLQFAADPAPVLRHARAHDLVWEKDNRTDHPPFALCAALSQKEYAALRGWITGYRGMLLEVADLDDRLLRRQDWFALLKSARLDGLWLLCAAQAGLPLAIFEREVMPRLLRDIAARYGCSVMRRPGTTSGPALLYLYGRKKDVCDYFTDEWDELSKSYNDPLSLPGVTRLLDPAITLPPLVTPYAGRLQVRRESIETLPWRGNAPDRSFNDDFQDLPWQPLWPYQAGSRARDLT